MWKAAPYTTVQSGPPQSRATYTIECVVIDNPVQWAFMRLVGRVSLSTFRSSFRSLFRFISLSLHRHFTLGGYVPKFKIRDRFCFHTPLIHDLIIPDLLLPTRFVGEAVHDVHHCKLPHGKTFADGIRPAALDTYGVGVGVFRVDAQW